MRSKGSWRTKKNRATSISLDLDFKRKLNLTERLSIVFLDQVSRDAKVYAHRFATHLTVIKFLEQLNIIDYSLLVGVHRFAEGAEHSTPPPPPLDFRK